MPPIELVTKRNWLAPDLWDWDIFLTNGDNTITTTFKVTQCPTADVAMWHADEYIRTEKWGWFVSGMHRIQANAHDE
jgi:hypothetical protein